ncbi:MAG: hypothetical protein V4650_14415 [Pseudomonadota bacterium]
MESRTEISASTAKTFTAYAPPLLWGVWTNILSHGGVVSKKITYAPIGDTVVMGKVRYYKKKDKQVEEEFKDETTITTADVWANIEVCFKGVVTGSTVEGTIE